MSCEVVSSVADDMPDDAWLAVVLGAVVPALPCEPVADGVSLPHTCALQLDVSSALLACATH